MGSNTQKYSENGVSISKASVSAGDKITVSYTGLLAQSGADNVFAHIGYGELWDDKAFVQMENEEGVFKATFKITKAGSLNMSFKDSAENWDNNSGLNYTFEIAEKEAKKATKAVSESDEKPAAKKVTKKKAKEEVQEAKAEAPKKARASKAAVKSEGNAEDKPKATRKKKAE